MRLGVALALVAAALSASGSTASGASAIPPVSSLQALPAPPKLPAGYVDALGYSSHINSFSPAAAVRSTRLLLSNVTGLPLYAFAAPGSRVCFFVWRGIGECGQIDAAQSILWGVNGGSWTRGQAVVGVVADRVRAVDVTLGTRRVRATVRHNAFAVAFHIARGASYPAIQVVPVTR